MTKGLILAGLLALTPGCAGAMEHPMWQGSARQANAPSQVLVAAQEDAWREIWTFVGEPAPSPLPNDKVAVAVFAGQKRTGGYGVEFTEVRDEAARTVVQYRLKAPGFDQMVSQVITSPYAVILVPQNGKPVVTEEAR